MFNRFVGQRRPMWTVVEALEVRALMTSLAGPAATEHVQVLELDAAAADHEESAEAIAVSELPPAVLAAVNARLPQATILAAETDTADGSVQFGVRTEFQGAELVVTLTPDGEVLEIEQTVAVADLPDAVSDWLAQQFPGAEILQAARVTMDGLVSYELVIAPFGQATIEANLRVADASSSLTLPIPSDAGGSELATAFAAESATSEPTESVSDAPSVQNDAREAVDPTVPIAANRTNNANNADSEPIRRHLATAQPPRLAKPQDIGADESLSATRLPLMERVLSEVLPVDFATLERALQEFLDGVDALTDPLAEGGPVRRWLPLAAAAAALCGIERVLCDRRKRDHDVALATVGRSSWTWVLKLSTVSRSRES